MAGDLVIDFHTAQFDFRGRSIFVRFSNEDQKNIQSAELGRGLLPQTRPEVNHGEDFNSISFSWPQIGSVSVQYIKHETGIEYKVEWHAIPSCKNLADTFTMTGSHWYGAAQILNQEWPIEKWVRSEMAFVAGDSFKDQYGGVQDRYWLSSQGLAIYVHHDVPLFVSMNNNKDQKLSLISKWSSPYKNLDNEAVKLSYRLFISSDVRKVHDLATGAVFCRPNGIPDELLFRFPIWSTWARYKKDINQDSVFDFAKQIKENGFKAAQIEIDDDWTPRYGDMEFDIKKFPDPGKMIEDLEKMGFRVTIWVHPFCSPLSKAASLPHWVKTGILPGHTIWWNGIGKILDVTKPGAAEWFKKSLLDLKEKFKLASFKFDAGEISWLPNMARPDTPWKSPNIYTTKYAEMCYECDSETRALEVRVGLRTQHLPVFVRMMDKDSNWGYTNGLKTLIPHALTFSVLGYPFILPDMIGGNAYSSTGIIGSSSDLPEKELFIRWLQANIFLPSLQFSISPWQYDEEVVKISKDLTKLRERYADTIVELAKESAETGAPIIRPLWWIAPEDENAQTIDNQFLLGDDIIVAPVLDKGAETRDIYLPTGIWHDELRKNILDGGKWYRNYDAKLHELPHFTRHEKEEELGGGEAGDFKLVPDDPPQQDACDDVTPSVPDVPQLVPEEEVKKIIESGEVVEEGESDLTEDVPVPEV